jgi:hypothetical protein
MFYSRERALIMAKGGSEVIAVKGTSVSIILHNQEDFVSLADIAKYKDVKTPRKLSVYGCVHMQP